MLSALLLNYDGLRFGAGAEITGTARPRAATAASAINSLRMGGPFWLTAAGILMRTSATRSLDLFQGEPHSR